MNPRKFGVNNKIL